MSVLVIVMIAVYACIHQFSGKERSNSFVCIAFCSCAHLDACLSEGILGTLAHSSADESINVCFLEKPRKSLMSYAVGAHNFRVDNSSAFNVVDLEFFCSAEMLEYISVVICYRYFHNYSCLSFLFSGIRIPDYRLLV